MTIASSVHKAKREYRCDICHQPITQGSRYTSMFGMADSGDKPYRIKLCSECCAIPAVPVADVPGLTNTEKEGRK